MKFAFSQKKKIKKMEFSLVAKGGNVAHAIASYARNVIDSIVRIEELPLSFSAILAADLVLQC
jgi:hypothetical protein